MSSTRRLSSIRPSGMLVGRAGDVVLATDANTARASGRKLRTYSLAVFAVSPCVHVASRNFFGLQPISSLQPGGFSAPCRTPSMLRSLLLLWAACTGRVSATWVCGGSVEITESWDGTKRINGHCEGKPQPNLPSPYPHLEREPANPRVARPMCPLNPHITSHQEASQCMHPLQASSTVPSSCQATGCRSVVEILP